MIIVGEKINTSRKAISEAVENKDAAAIQAVARTQADAGADYIDVNAGTFLERELELLPWLVEIVQAEVDLPLCLDSPNPEALKRAMKVHRGRPLINSISLEKDRYDSLLPVVSEAECRIVALCMAQTSMPTTADERIAVAAELIEGLMAAGMAPEDIFVDPLVQPVSVDVRMGPAVLEAIAGVTDRFPGVGTICGLSNISYGLPARRLINRHFLGLAIARGLSAAILDPTDAEIMSALAAVDMLLGKDEYCSRYIEAFERGLFAKNA
ncbi:MAG: dihydropteroate synthase [Desulfobacterales bacterium]|jgi:5-methyltetrahydrofolate--homocysteine methyltransferase